MLQTGRIKTVEHKARRRAIADRLRRRIDHGVDEAPRGTDHRDRAVPLGIELRQAAGLEQAGHERDVGGCLHEMGEPFFEPDDHVDRARKCCGDLPQGVFLVAAPRAQNHEVHASRTRQLRDRIEDQRDALLLDEPADERRQWPRVGGSMAQTGRECDAGRILALLDIGLAEASRQEWISRRVPE